MMTCTTQPFRQQLATRPLQLLPINDFIIYQGGQYQHSYAGLSPAPESVRLLAIDVHACGVSSIFLSYHEVFYHEQSLVSQICCTDPPMLSPYHTGLTRMSEQAVHRVQLPGRHTHTAAMSSSLLLVQLGERKVRADVEDDVERYKDPDAGPDAELVSPEV